MSAAARAISRCSAARRSRCSARATAASMSMPPSAPAATAARSSACREPGSSASTATARRSPADSIWSMQSDGRLTLVEDRFSNLAEVCAAQGVAGVDGVVMDVGVSSMQLDQAERGFSFRLDGPLDMRMGQDGPTAADVVAKASEADLANIIYIFGEERSFPRRRPRHRRRAQGSADHDDAGAGRYRRQGGVRQAERDPSGDADVSGPADFRQRGTRRTASGAVRGRARAEARRPARGGVVPFAGRPHRQGFPQPSAARPAADRGICPKWRRPRRAFRS